MLFANSTIFDFDALKVKILRQVTHMYSDFLGVKVTVAPLLSMVFSLKLGEWSRSTYSHIVGMEIGIDDQLTIIHQAGIING